MNSKEKELTEVLALARSHIVEVCTVMHIPLPASTLSRIDAALSQQAEPDSGRINWETTEEDDDLIAAVVERALKESPDELGMDKLTLTMDLTACHLNGCPLRLKALLEADEFNFAHDIMGIRNHIDRMTGKLTGFFEPRFAKVGL